MDLVDWLLVFVLLFTLFAEACGLLVCVGCGFGVVVIMIACG